MGAAALHWRRPRERPSEVRRLLIVQHLLLGDTVMLTPLLKKARARYPRAEIAMAVPSAYAPLYDGKPYGVEALPFDARSIRHHRALRGRGGFDLALVPGDNRWSWLARAMQARWIVAFAPDATSYHEWPIDELRPLPAEPMSWADMASALVDGPDPQPFTPGEWPAPRFAAYRKPQDPYCVLHLGASSPHKLWPAERWRAVQEWAETRGFRVVLSAGRGEGHLLSPVDPQGTRSELAGRLDLAQLWDLLSHAAFLVSPDTGVAHLARLVGVPTVVIYGPGSPISSGPGRFWAKSPFRALWDPDIPCRNQDRLFGRKLIWLRQCWRGVAECGDPYCIRRISVEQVAAAIGELTSASQEQ